MVCRAEEKNPPAREDDEPGGIFLGTPNSVLWGRVSPAPGVPWGPGWSAASARGYPSAAIICAGSARTSSCGVLELLGRSEKSRSEQGVNKLSKGGQHHQGRVGAAGGFRRPGGGCSPSTWKGLDFKHPCPTLALHTPHGHTDTPASAQAFTRPRQPSVLDTGVAVPGHPRGCDQGAGRHLPQRGHPNGKTLGFGLSPARNRLARGSGARDAVGMRWEPCSVAGQAEPSRSDAAARHRGN